MIGVIGSLRNDHGRHRERFLERFAPLLDAVHAKKDDECILGLLIDLAEKELESPSIRETRCACG